MRFLKIASLVLCLFVVLEAGASAQTLQDQQIQQIQQSLNNWRVRQNIPGATLSLYLSGQNTPVTFASGVASRGGNENITDNTLYQAGSITKSFTSAIILKLESEGKLNINDPIVKYLPQYPQWSNVTIRELLNHTSGIFNYTEAGVFNRIRETTPRAEFTPAEIVHIASQQRDYFPPGKGWKYSNTNYVLAGMIIEKVTGKPIGDVMNYYLRQGGFKVSLPNTYYAPGIYTSSFVTRMAHGYNSGGVDTTYDNMSWACTVGAIVTNTQDLLTWWRGLFQGNVLPQEQLNEMMSLVCEGGTPGCSRGQPVPHVNEDGGGKGYGLGIIQSGFGSEKIGTVWWHNGSTRGYKALVMWFPKSDIYMSLMIDRDPGYLLKPDLPLVRQVLSVLVPGLAWHPAVHPKPELRRHEVRKEIVRREAVRHEAVRHASLEHKSESHHHDVVHHELHKHPISHHHPELRKKEDLERE